MTTTAPTTTAPTPAPHSELSGCGTCACTGKLRNPNTGRVQTCMACNGAGRR